MLCLSLNPCVFLCGLSACIFITEFKDRLMKPAVLLGHGSGPGLIAAPEREFDKTRTCISQIPIPLPILGHRKADFPQPCLVCFSKPKAQQDVQLYL